VHNIEDEQLMGAICCDLAFNAKLNPEGRLSHEFQVLAGEVDWGPNVVSIFD
jgi:hypothetical protein